MVCPQSRKGENTRPKASKQTTVLLDSNREEKEEKKADVVFPRRPAEKEPAVIRRKGKLRMDAESLVMTT